jgi:hypothetical protein
MGEPWQGLENVGMAGGTLGMATLHNEVNGYGAGGLHVTLVTSSPLPLHPSA